MSYRPNMVTVYSVSCVRDDAEKRVQVEVPELSADVHKRRQMATNAECVQLGCSPDDETLRVNYVITRRSTQLKASAGQVH